MEIIQFLQEQNIPFEQNVHLSKKSWIKTGGICGCWIVPQTVGQLTETCKYLYANKIDFDIVGQTSNIFFHSTYNPEIVVSTIKVNQYVIKDGYVVCDGGVSVVKLAKDCLAQGYAGFYGLVGLPGTVASAIVNNSGCFQCSLSSMLVNADVLLPDGSVTTISKEDFGYTHRSSAFKQGEKRGIILSVKFKVEKAEDINGEYKKSEDAITYRKEKQERQAGLTLGSVYAVRRVKKNLRNYMTKVAMRVFPRLLKMQARTIEKKALLLLYGYRDLDGYVSDRQINTFIWKDEKAEAAFARYKEMMNKIYKNPTIEIEEKY